jgi:hypothetical protein
MAQDNLAYDNPAYSAPHVFAGNTTVGANGISQKFAAFTAMQIKAVQTSPNGRVADCRRSGVPDARH